MPTFTPHFLLQMIGTVGTANPEIWSSSIRLHSLDYTGFDEIAYMNGVAKDACAAWLTRTTSKIGVHVNLDKIKFNFINAAGHYDDPGNTNEYIYPTPPAGGGGGSTQPYQACVVLTWLTDARSRGLASRGRIYSPGPSVTPNATTGLFPTGDAQGIATSAAEFLNTLDIGFGTPPSINTLRPHIMSGVDGSFSEINTVSVDNRIDIQRRRANQLVPAKFTAPVLY